MLSRRAFLRNSLVASSALATGLMVHDLLPDSYTGTPRIEERVIPIPDLPSAFHGYRIGFLTDLHLGIWVPQLWVAEALEVLAHRGVDILVLGGDYIYINETKAWQAAGLVRNSDYNELSRKDASLAIYQDMGRLISRASFPDGILGVVGNHDHWNFYPLFLKTFRDFPSIRLLINQEHTVSRRDHNLHFFGVDDFLTGIPTRPPERKRDTRNARVLVSHNPDYVAALLDQDPNSFDLALCGHTHGGQVALPVVGGVLIQIRDNRFMSGLAEVGESHVYTSRGLGVVGLPFRVNCPAEITICELRPA